MTWETKSLLNLFDLVFGNLCPEGRSSNFKKLFAYHPQIMNPPLLIFAFNLLPYLFVPYPQITLFVCCNKKIIYQSSRSTHLYNHSKDFFILFENVTNSESPNWKLLATFDGLLDRLCSVVMVFTDCILMDMYRIVVVSLKPELKDHVHTVYIQHNTIIHKK